MKIHKARVSGPRPKVSLILLDWSCRERFVALDWLARQDVPREEYEVIWVELYDRVVPEVMEHADVVITCGQKGRYHKHKGYNAGLLEARGEVTTICDSDAVFPPDFISSIKDKFALDRPGAPTSLVLMHYERRTKSTYPTGMTDLAELRNHYWVPLWENVGACVSARTDDVIRFGGFDEHESYRGYVCGPYELAWRLVNAGMLEEWHDPAVTLWHFDHPNEDHINIYKRLRRATFLELGFIRPHLREHSLTAVEGFSMGRLLPLKEHPRVHDLRMSRRRIGSSYETPYGKETGPRGFSRRATLLMRALHLENMIVALLRTRAPFLLRIYSHLMSDLAPKRLRRWRYKTLGTVGVLCAEIEDESNVLSDDSGTPPRHERDFSSLFQAIWNRPYDNRLHNSANDGFCHARAGQRVDGVSAGAVLTQVMLFMDKVGDPQGVGSCVVRRVSDDSIVGTLGTVHLSRLPATPADPRWVRFNTASVKFPGRGDHRVVFEWDPAAGDQTNYPRVRFNDTDTIRGVFTQYSHAETRWIDHTAFDASIRMTIR